VAGPAGPRGVVTNVLKKTLALDYSPQEWAADLLHIVEQTVENFAAITSDRALTIEYDQEAEFAGPYYFQSTKEVSAGFKVVKLKPRVQGSVNRRVRFGVLANVRQETDPVLADANLPDLIPAEWLKRLQETREDLYSVALVNLGQPPRVGYTPPPRGRYEGKVSLGPNHSLDITVCVLEATPLLPATASALVNLCDQLPILAGKLYSKLSDA
jgi:hypothetical protein